MKKIRNISIIALMFILIFTMVRVVNAQIEYGSYEFKIKKLRDYSSPQRGYCIGTPATGSVSGGRYLWDIYQSMGGTIKPGNYYCVNPDVGFTLGTSSSETYTAKVDLDNAEDVATLLAQNNSIANTFLNNANLETLKSKANLFYLPESVTDNQYDAVYFQKYQVLGGDEDEWCDSDSDYLSTDLIMAIQQKYIWSLIDPSNSLYTGSTSQMQMVTSEDDTGETGYYHDIGTDITKGLANEVFKYLKNTEPVENLATATLGKQMIDIGSYYLLGPLNLSVTGSASYGLSLTDGENNSVNLLAITDAEGNSYSGSSADEIIRNHLGQDLYFKVAKTTNTFKITGSVDYTKVKKYLYVNLNSTNYQPIVELALETVSPSFAQTYSSVPVETDFNIVFNKVNEAGTFVPGATFKVNGTNYQISSENVTYETQRITSSNKTLTYEIEEVTAPNGYKVLDGKYTLTIPFERDGDKWVVDTASVNIKYVNSSGVEQPQSVISFNSSANTITFSIKNKVDTVMDLALRKYITKVGDTAVTNRTPNIDKSTISTEKTATYNHRKDPVEVEKGQNVEYTITIYNEGTSDGYAKEIVDQLPTNLEYVSFTSNEYTLKENDSTNNKVIFEAKDTITPLGSYDGTNLNSTSITVVCKVLDTAVADTVLTNVAYISREMDTTQNLEVLNVGEDVDSLPANHPTYTKDNLADYKGNTSNKDVLPADETYFYKGLQDDDDFEKLIVVEKNFDLALRKYITKVGDTVVTNRTPNIDKTTIATTKTATYNHRKDPVEVEKGQNVEYTITVYNEGINDGYAKEIVDQLPTNLEYVSFTSNEYTLKENDTTNNKVIFEAKDTITPLGGYDGTNLNSTSIKVVCKVLDTAVANKVLTNVAYISREMDTTKNIEVLNVGEDFDSLPSNHPTNTKDNLENYKGNTANKDVTPADETYFYKGEQDDDDFEKVVVIEKTFDLALRKYITKVGGTAVTNRTPNIDKSTIATTKTATYKHRKDPVEVVVGTNVEYTITIYNEGDNDGYAKEIVDQLPTNLEYVSFTSNEYTLKENDSTNNKVIFEAKDTITPLGGYDGTNLNSTSIKVVCKVLDTAVKNQVLTNVAYISREMDTTQNIEVLNVGEDFDSLPSNHPTNTKDNLADYKGNTANKDVLPADETYFYKGEQDDDDFEKLIVIEKVFDLALRKYITKIDSTNITDRIPDIDKTTIETKQTATYKHKKTPLEVELNSTIEYTITVYNEGTVNGRASKIVDVLPTGIVFDNVVSGDYQVESYIESTNILTLSKKTTDNLPGFTNNVLSSNTVVIKCHVDMEMPSRDTILTNVAYIAEEYKEGMTDPIVNQEDVDFDSEPGNKPNVTKDSMENYTGKVDYTVEELNQNKFYEGQQDDDDFEKVYVKYQPFDLKLVKRITQVDFKNINERIEQTNFSKLNTIDPTNNKRITTGDYTLNKEPVLVNQGSIVKYTFRVYNEGYQDGYAAQITEDIPQGLKFLWSDLEGDDLKNSTAFTDDEKKAIEFNQSQYWVIDERSNTIHTDYLSKEREVRTGDNLILAYPKDGNGQTPSYKEVSVMLQVTSDELGTVLRNEAAITKETNSQGNVIEDRDSDPNNWVKYEDDEDYDNVIIQAFDLVLRKWIMGVSKDNVFQNEDKLLATDGSYLREPAVITTKLDATTDGKTTSDYNHPKTPIVVSVGEYVIYDIRVYNEGGVDGYAAEITDYLPNYLKFVDCDFNKQYNWKATNDRVITTDYLKNKVVAKRTERNGEYVLSYVDVPIMCQVVGVDEKNNILTNIAEITVYEDNNHNVVKDRDSVQDNLNYPTDTNLPTYKDNEQGKYIPGQEDDDDFEKIKVYKFDLALRKWVTESIVTVDGKTVTTPTNNQPYDNPETPAKVEVNRKKIDSTVVKFKYKIRVINEGNLEGYATEITDRIPDGLKFVSADNPLWTVVDAKTVTTNQLQETLLQPGEYKDIEIILTWENSKTNLGQKVNWAEITKDQNKYNIPDIDSVPNNSDPNEDDIDNAPVLLSISTGQARIFYGALFILIPACVILTILKVKDDKKRRGQR